MTTDDESTFRPFDFFENEEEGECQLTWTDAAFTTYEKLFDEEEAECNGYAWTEIIESLVGAEEPELLEELLFDPEAGTVSISGARADLAKVAAMVRGLLENKDALRAAIASSGEDEDGDIDETIETFASVPAAHRIAFAAAAAARILPIYERTAPGDDAKEVLATIELGWLAATGTKLEAGEVQARSERLSAIIVGCAEESLDLLEICAEIARSVLECAQPEDDEDGAVAAARVYYAALDAASGVDEELGNEEDAPGSAAAEEAEWLAAALERCVAWKKPVTRELFRDLGAAPPGWWPAYAKSQG